MRKKWIFFLVMSLFACSMLVGCGGDEGEPSAESTSNGEAAVNNEIESVEDDLTEIEFTDDPTSLAEGWVSDVGSFVKYIESGQWTLGGAIKIFYEHDGTETVDGVPTEKMKFFIDNLQDEDESAEYSMWVDETGEIVQIGEEGEIFEEQIGMELYFIKMMTFPALLPFMTEEPGHISDFTQTMAGQDVSGWNVFSRESTRQNISGNQVHVYSVELQHTAWGEKPVKFTFGDFGDIRMLLSWDDETGETIFETNALNLR